MTSLADVIAAAPHVLLDFDGPVCAVFGGAISDADAAGMLRAVLDHHGTPIPPAIRDSSDPFQVLRYAGTLGTDVRDAVGDRLTAAEVEAIRTAPATPGARDAIAALHGAGHTVTVVSNNSEVAIGLFLTAHDLLHEVTGVVGRTSSDPELLKPDPHLLREAMRARAACPSSCVLIGDSLTDAEAAHAARVPCIGFANKPGKAEKLDRAVVAVVVGAMTDIATAVVAVQEAARN
jgi:phosphoglycolate phosphatase